MFSPLCFKN